MWKKFNVFEYFSSKLSHQSTQLNNYVILEISSGLIFFIRCSCFCQDMHSYFVCVFIYDVLCQDVGDLFIVKTVVIIFSYISLYIWFFCHSGRLQSGFLLLSDILSSLTSVTFWVSYMKKITKKSCFLLWCLAKNDAAKIALTFLNCGHASLSATQPGASFQVLLL